MGDGVSCCDCRLSSRFFICYSQRCRKVNYQMTELDETRHRLAVCSSRCEQLESANARLGELLAYAKAAAREEYLLRVALASGEQK